MSNKASPYLVLLDISEKGRQKLLDDVFHQMPNVYDILYTNPHTESFQLYMELYDLIWIKSH